MRHFVECPSPGVYLVVFLWLDYSYVFWKEDQRHKVSSSSQHTKGTNDKKHYWCWLWSASWSSVAMLFHVVILFLPFPQCTLRKKVTTCSQHFKEWEVTLEGRVSTWLICNFFARDNLFILLSHLLLSA